MVGIWSAGRPAKLAEPSSVAEALTVFAGMVDMTTSGESEFVEGGESRSADRELEELSRWFRRAFWPSILLVKLPALLRAMLRENLPLSELVEFTEMIEVAPGDLALSCGDTTPSSMQGSRVFLALLSAGARVESRSGK